MIRFRSSFLLPMFTLALLVSTAVFAQGPVPVNAKTVEELLSFPVTTEEALVSFDWDPSGVLHYTVGNPNWGTGTSVYKAGEGAHALVYTDPGVWAGSRVGTIGAFMYFNDGGDFTRSDFNYYRYDPTMSGSVSPWLEAPFEASLWGLQTRHEGEFFASGSAATWGPGALFYGQLDEEGEFLSRPLLQFGEVGDSPGPLCFDGQGRLYYVPGYSYEGAVGIYRWTAEEVTAAMADPLGSALSPDNHVWNTLPAPYDGATGLACDSFGNVYVSATAWGAPSQLLLFNGPSSAGIVVAEYEGRLETVRYRDNSVAVSCAPGVFSVPLLQFISGTESAVVTGKADEPVIFSVDVAGGIGELHYQWFEESANKGLVPVGTDTSFYSFTVKESDQGKRFYCEVSDASCTLQSGLFTLSVEKSVPAVSGVGLVLLVSLLVLMSGGLFLRRGGVIS